MAKTVGYPVEHQHSGELEAAPRKREQSRLECMSRHTMLVSPMNHEETSDLSGSRQEGSGSRVVIRPAVHEPSEAERERLAYSVDEAAAVLGVARETIYELIRTGELRSRKAGSRRIIGRHHLLDFLDGAGSLADRPAG